MAMNASSGFRPDQENVGYIGAGVTLKGEVSVPDLIVVDGTLEGNITARVVCVGQTGVIRGNISATEADISGWISDHIDIKQLLVVRSTGRVEGKVMYGEIELEKGAVVTGELSATDDYRAITKAPQQKSAHDGPPPAPMSPTKPATSSLDRISDAVRAKTAGGGLKANLYLAADADGPKRSGPARLSLTGRKLSG
ncbi:MAG: polymer-forming cytoskeletal protein [Methylocystis sp.]|nr:polymer-forming cytoskeletal protein [Methylocystis sp.]